MKNGADELSSNSYKGIIVKSTGGLYTVQTDTEEFVDCRAKGAFRHSKITPLAGDRVCFEKDREKDGFITEIEQRKNSLVRPAVANVDLLCIVVAAKNPAPDLFILDKLCAVARNNKIEVLLIVNKVDLQNGEELCEIYEKAGFCVVKMCAMKSEEYKDEIEKIRRISKGKTSFFTGASGVGKSSVLNATYPNLSLETGEISKKIGRGKHTTRITTLFKTDDNTYVGDTPGFSMLDVVGFNMLEFDTLLSCFPDIEKYACDCKYKKCTHICEDGCKVIEALEGGNVSPSRHESYVALYKELKTVKPWDN